MENPEAMLDVLSMQTFRQRFGPNSNSSDQTFQQGSEGLQFPDEDEQLENLVRDLCIDDSISICFADSESDVNSASDVKAWLPVIKDETSKHATKSSNSSEHKALESQQTSLPTTDPNQFQQPVALTTRRINDVPSRHSGETRLVGQRRDKSVDISRKDLASISEVPDVDLFEGTVKDDNMCNDRNALTLKRDFSPFEVQNMPPRKYLEEADVRPESFVSSDVNSVGKSMSEKRREGPEVHDLPDGIEKANGNDGLRAFVWSTSQATSFPSSRTRYIDSQQKKSALQRMAEKSRLRRKKNASSTNGSPQTTSSHENVKTLQSKSSNGDSNESLLKQVTSSINDLNPSLFFAMNSQRQMCNQEHQPDVCLSDEDVSAERFLRTSSADNASETKAGNPELYSLPSSISTTSDVITDGRMVTESVPWYEDNTIQCEELTFKSPASCDVSTDAFDFHDVQKEADSQAKRKRLKHWYETGADDGMSFPGEGVPRDKLTIRALIERSARMATPEPDASSDDLTDENVTSLDKPETKVVSTSVPNANMSSAAGKSDDSTTSAKHQGALFSSAGEISFTGYENPLDRQKSQSTLDDHSPIYANQYPPISRTDSPPSVSIPIANHGSVVNTDTALPVDDSSNTTASVQTLASNNSISNHEELVKDFISRGESELLKNLMLDKSFFNVDWRQNSSTQTSSPFHLAIQLGRLECLRILLQSQPLLEQCGWSEGFSLELATAAVRSNQVKCLLLLHYMMSLQAMTGTVDVEGNTLMHLAASLGHKDVTVALISLGHDANVENQAGVTPLQLCLQHSAFTKDLDSNEQNVSSSSTRTSLTETSEEFPPTDEGTTNKGLTNSNVNCNAGDSDSTERSKGQNSVHKSNGAFDGSSIRSSVQNDGSHELKNYQRNSKEEAGQYANLPVVDYICLNEGSSLNNGFVGRVQVLSRDIKHNPYTDNCYQDPIICLKPNDENENQNQTASLVFQEFVEWMSKHHNDNQWLHLALKEGKTQGIQEGTLAGDQSIGTRSKSQENTWTQQEARELINNLPNGLKLDTSIENPSQQGIVEYLKMLQECQGRSSPKPIENESKREDQRERSNPSIGNIAKERVFSSSSISSDSLKSYTSSAERDHRTSVWPAATDATDLHGNAGLIEVNSRVQKKLGHRDDLQGNGAILKSHNKHEQVDSFCISSDELYSSPADTIPSLPSKPRSTRHSQSNSNNSHGGPVDSRRRTNTQTDRKAKLPPHKYVEDALYALDGGLDAENGASDLKANSEILSLFLDSSSTSQDPNDDSQRDDLNDANDERTRRREARRRRWGGLSLLPHHLKKKIERLSQKGKKKGTIDGGVSGSSNSNSNSSSSVITSSSSSGGRGGYNPDGNSSVRTIVDFRDDGHDKYRLDHLRLQNRFQPMHEKPTGSANFSLNFARAQDARDWWHLHLLSRRNQSKRRKELTTQHGSFDKGFIADDLEGDQFWSPVDSFSSMTPVSEDDESDFTDSVSDFSYDDDSMSEFSDLCHGPPPSRHRQYPHLMHHPPNHRSIDQSEQARCHQNRPGYHRRRRHECHDLSPSRGKHGPLDNGSEGNTNVDDNDDDEDSDVTSEDPRVRVNVDNEDWPDEMLRVQRLAMHLESVQRVQSGDSQIIETVINGTTEILTSPDDLIREPNHVNIGEAYPFRSNPHEGVKEKRTVLRTKGTTSPDDHVGKRTKLHLFNHEKLCRDGVTERRKNKESNANLRQSATDRRHRETDRQDPWHQLAFSESEDSDMGDLNSR